MKKIFTLISISLATLSQSNAVIHVIDVRDNYFSPATLSINLGDTVVWNWVEGVHTTSSTNIPSGASAWSTVINQSGAMYEYIPQVAGTYDYECLYHSSMGMNGQFVVNDATGISTPKEKIVRLRSSRVDEYLTVEMPELRDMLIPTVRDLTGRAIKTFEAITFETTSLYVGDLKNGIYLLELFSGRQRISYRFIKY